MTFVDEAAYIEADVRIGVGSRVWRQAHLRRGSRVGRDCTIGAGAFIDVGVVVGDRVKVQNNALLYAPAVVEDGVFIGPAAVLTNDRAPRAVRPDGELTSVDDWSPVAVTLSAGCSLGAHSVCVAPVTIGRWATVGAGAVVTSDVNDHALVAGVPARQIGWVGRSGVRLLPVAGDAARWSCPRTGQVYRVATAGLELEEP